MTFMTVNWVIILTEQLVPNEWNLKLNLISEIIRYILVAITIPEQDSQFEKQIGNILWQYV